MFIVIKNYSGDIMSFEMAQRYGRNGKESVASVVADDIAVIAFTRKVERSVAEYDFSHIRF